MHELEFYFLGGHRRSNLQLTEDGSPRRQGESLCSHLAAKKRL